MRIAVALIALFASMLAASPTAGALSLPGPTSVTESGTSSEQASAETSPMKAAGDAPAVVRLRDRRGDVRSPKGDLVAASLVYGEPNIKVRAVTSTMASVRSRRWQHGLTTMFWYLDTNDTYGDEYVVWLYNNGRDRIRAEVHEANDTERLVCRGRFRAKSSYQVRFPASCIGTPKRLRFHVSFGYDVKPKKSDGRVDVAPARGYSDSARQPRFKTQFTDIYAPAVGRGEPTGVNATLVRTSDGQSLWDRPVQVYARPRGATKFTLVGKTRSSDYDGRVYWGVTASRSTDYRLRFPGTRSLLPSLSPTIPINVVRQVHIFPMRSDYAVGQSIRLSGTVAPAHSGLGVILQRQTKTGWVDEATTTTGTPDEGEAAPYEISFEPATSGAFTYRVVATGDQTYADSPSDNFEIVVVAAEITAVEAGNGPSDALDPNAEFIVVTNTGTVTVYLGSWLVEANLVEVGTIAQGALAPGQSVQIHTGSGTDTPQQLYLGRSRPMWTEAGGIARLYHVNGQLAHEFQYPPG